MFETHMIYRLWPKEIIAPFLASWSDFCSCAPPLYRGIHPNATIDISQCVEVLVAFSHYFGCKAIRVYCSKSCKILVYAAPDIYKINISATPHYVPTSYNKSQGKHTVLRESWQTLWEWQTVLKSPLHHGGQEWCRSSREDKPRC